MHQTASTNYFRLPTESSIQQRRHDSRGTTTFCEWMTSHISDRFQTICVDCELSLPVLMEHSVPRGSVLGPKHYVLYPKSLATSSGVMDCSTTFTRMTHSCTCHSNAEMPSSRLRHGRTYRTASTKSNRCLDVLEHAKAKK